MAKAIGEVLRLVDQHELVDLTVLEEKLTPLTATPLECGMTIMGICGMIQQLFINHGLTPPPGQESFYGMSVSGNVPDAQARAENTGQFKAMQIAIALLNNDKLTAYALCQTHIDAGVEQAIQVVTGGLSAFRQTHATIHGWAITPL